MDFFWFKIDNMLKILYARQVLLGFKKMSKIVTINHNFNLFVRLVIRLVIKLYLFQKSNLKTRKVFEKHLYTTIIISEFF